MSSRESLYTFQTFAEIDSISMATGSVHGGATMVINGRFFDPANVKVKVAGELCVVCCSLQFSNDISVVVQCPQPTNITGRIHYSSQDKV